MRARRRAATHGHRPAHGTEVYAEDPRHRAPSILRARCVTCRKRIVYVEADRDRQAYWRVIPEGSPASR